MKFYRYRNNNNVSRLIAEVKSGRFVDLSTNSPIRGFTDLVRWANLLGESINKLTEKLGQDGDREVSQKELGEQGLKLARPLVPREVWAAGVTYRVSRDERKRESEIPDPYSRVYTAERPEIFFKATADRCVGPGESIGVRGDSSWNVPEPELAFILHGGRITGYTVGNDVSSRSIEGKNPLYLSQAKVYQCCCAIGPCILSAESLPDPHNLQIHCEIFRSGQSVFLGNTSTSQMVRTCQELADFLTRHNPVPDGTVVLTGTGIVPQEDFSLQSDDVVRISIEGIGILENSTIQV